MKAIFSDYSLSQFNKDINHLIKDEVVNNIKLFAATDEAKISVVMKPCKDSTSYYGLHPKFSTDKMMELLFKQNMINCCTFWDTIKQQQDNENTFKLNGLKSFDNRFSLTQYEYEELFFGRSFLQMASHFGFRMYCQDDIKDEVKTIIGELWEKAAPQSQNSYDSNYFFKENTFFTQWSKGEEETYVDFLGIWPETILQKLDGKLQVHIKEKLNNTKFFIEIKNKDFANLSNELTFFKLYEFKEKEGNPYLKEKFKLREGNIYYSGTMPRVKKITYDTDHPASEKVKYLIFEVERTTFATVDCMDNPLIILHPYFNSRMEGRERLKYDYLLEFDRHEDEVQSEFLYNKEEVSFEKQEDYEKVEITKINKYLKNSFNTHTVAVSANIETTDNYLLVGKRGKGTIDNGTYYCSVNGQSEFYDHNVSYYQDSVYEDLPTMNYDSDKRIDLNNEIHRETIAELGISMFEQDWQYYGVSYLSINNFSGGMSSDGNLLGAGTHVSKRRMHFNVLTYNKSYSTFEEIYKNHENVTEKFENSLIEGIRFNLFKDWIACIQYYFKKASELAYNHSGIISFSILTITLLFSLINNQMDEFSSIEVSEIIEVSVVIIYVVLLLSKWLSDREIRQRRRAIKFNVGRMQRNLNQDYLTKLFGKLKRNKLVNRKTEETFQMHAILKVMVTLHFLKKRIDHI